MTFNDHDNVPVTASVSCVNQKTVSVTPDNMVGRWRVWVARTNRLDKRQRRCQEQGDQIGGEEPGKFKTLKSREATGRLTCAFLVATIIHACRV